MMHRRQTLALLAAAFVPPAFGASRAAEAPGMSRATAYAFAFTMPSGESLRLVGHAGKPILIVNTASLCGYARQFGGLEALWTHYRDRGLVIIGVPSNDFGAQEPGGAAEIAAAAQEHGVTFPLTTKVAVKGPDAHPFYRWAAAERPGAAPRWNFHKYLVGRDGRLAAAFPSATEPDDPQLVAAIERELAD
jgi:glutathione peroxidase